METILLWMFLVVGHVLRLLVLHPCSPHALTLPPLRTPGQERERQRELELIKQQYLGGERAKKKVLKATERMKFVFDWDADEDTSRDLNPLYQNLHGGCEAVGMAGWGEAV